MCVCDNLLNDLASVYVYCFSRKHSRGSREEKNDTPEQKRITGVDPGVSDKSSGWSAKKKKERGREKKSEEKEEEKKLGEPSISSSRSGPTKAFRPDKFLRRSLFASALRQPSGCLTKKEQRTAMAVGSVERRRQVPREACVSLPLQPLLLLPFRPHPFLCRPPARNREKGNASERGKIETAWKWKDERERERERKKGMASCFAGLSLSPPAPSLFIFQDFRVRSH